MRVWRFSRSWRLSVMRKLKLAVSNTKIICKILRKNFRLCIYISPSTFRANYSNRYNTHSEYTKKSIIYCKTKSSLYNGRTRARAEHPWSKYRCGGSGLRCPWPFIVPAEHALAVVVRTLFSVFPTWKYNIQVCYKSLLVDPARFP